MGRISRAFYDFSKWLTIKQNYIARASGLWASHLRFIESRFGTGIVSYFSLYRWNFVLNLFLGLLWLVFVILFGILDMFRNNNEGWLKFWNGPYLNQTMDAGTFAQQLFSGQGSIERSFFLYGNYKSRYDNYQLDLAYMGLIFAFYIFSFVAIISRMRKLFVSRPEVSGNISVDEASPFGTVVFASWDYCISQKDTQTNHCFAVSTVLKTLITRVEISEKQKKISRRDKVYNILRRVFGNLIVLILLGSYGFLILISLASQFSSQISWLIPVTQTSAYKWTQTFPNFVSSTALLISFFNATLPLLFWGVTRFERYTDPVNEARIMLARTYLMKMSSIYIVLVGYFYTYSDEKSGKNWENEIGKTYYQLIWTNFLFTAVGTILIGFGTRVFLGKRFYDFGISDNILEVIYRQALVWVGTVYSPMAIIISLATSYLLFFIKKFVLVHCSLPPKRIYNSYTQNLYFLGFQLVTLGLMAFPVFYSITRMKPTCGPFGPEIFPAGQGKQLDYAYQLVSDSISGIRYPFFRESLTFIGSVGFILPLILLLSIWIYYLRAVSDKRQKRSKQLQYELNMERADKKFLLRYYKVKL